ncbi:hypothetical protein ACFQVC_03890 [Streptomyces monticola]|uniref:Uncharacterized protein n=1 Tax=Streptomyces monticola TaxID=2666263 RepID=A0ABW2JBK0_9ACTN
MAGRGKRRQKTFTVGSYVPLDDMTATPTPAQDATVGAFFQDVADLVFKGGPRGMELTAMDALSRTFSFRHLDTPDPRALVSEAGEVPADDTGRAGVLWTPQPGSPAWAHLAWLLQELPFVAAFREYGPQGGPTLLGVESPGRSHAEVLVEHRGGRWRVRVDLEGRTEPLESPGMVIGELFGEGGHRDRVRDGVVHARV